MFKLQTLMTLNLSLIPLNYYELINTETDNSNGIIKNATVTVPLKHLSNFCRSLEMPLINYKVEFKDK